jgi:hypothetical protein
MGNHDSYSDTITAFQSFKLFQTFKKFDSVVGRQKRSQEQRGNK